MEEKAPIVRSNAMTLIPAVYENGVFRPLEPVQLPEAASVNLVIYPQELARAKEALDRCFGALKDSWTEHDDEILRQIAADRHIVSPHRAPIQDDCALEQTPH